MPSDVLQKKQSSRFTYYDLAAVLMLAGFAVFYFFEAFKSIQLVDESFFITIPHRLFLGDRLIVDEWQVSQFVSALQYLPFRIFRMFNASNEGIVLFERLLFAAVHIIVSSAIYTAFRKYGVLSLIGTFLFCSFVPINVMALNYYTISTFLFEIVCIFLFCSKKAHSPAILIICGVLTAGMVLAEPLSALIYFGYTAAAAILFVLSKKGKKTSFGSDFIFGIKDWLFLTAGIVFCAALFLVFLFSRCDIKTLITSIPNFFTDSEYQEAFSSKKVAIILCAYKSWMYAAALLIAVIAVICRKKKANTLFPICAAAILSLTVSICAYVNSSDTFFSYYAFYFQRFVPIVYLAVICILAGIKLPHKLTAFFACGIMLSLARDFSSDISFGFSLSVAIVPAVVIIGITVKELYINIFADKKLKLSPSVKALFRSRMIPRKKKACISVICVMLVCLLLTQVVSFAVLSCATELKENVFFEQDSDPLDTVLQRGPMKNIKTTRHAADIYNSMLNDMDIIKKNCSGPVYIFGLASWLYLYLDLPYSTYSAWFVDSDFDTRQLLWWELHPDKLPECIYIPFIDHDSYEPDTKFTKQRLNEIKELCSCRIIKSETGYTVFVEKWNI